MRKALLFAILTLSVNVIAQSNHSEIIPQHPALISIENAPGMIGNGAFESPVMQSEKNSGQDVKNLKSQPQSVFQIYDSIYNWQWDALGGEWKIYSRFIDFEYDTINHLTSKKFQVWFGDTIWANSKLYTYTWFIDNNLESEEISYRIPYSWFPEIRRVYAYDGNNNISSKTEIYFDENQWVYTMKYTYEYDANNNLINELWLWWNGSEWENSRKYIYTYDTSNNLVSALKKIFSNGWKNWDQYTYTYDGSNYLISKLYETWAGGWRYSQKYTYTYDLNNHQIGWLGQAWNGQMWENNQQCTYFYHANNNQSIELIEKVVGSNWKNSERHIYVNDENNYRLNESHLYWNESGTKIASGDSTHYYFNTVLGVNDLIVPGINIKIYPNPGSGKFSISSSSAIDAIEIYNLIGERIYSDFKLNQQATVNIDLSNQARGIYFVKICRGANTFSRKIILQ